MNHIKYGIPIENMLRSLNGDGWLQSANLIDTEPTKYLTIGFLEHLLNGDSQRAHEIYWLMRLWKNSGDEQTEAMLDELLADRAAITGESQDQ